MRLICVFIFLSIFGCTKNNNNYTEELTETVQKKYNIIFGNDIELKSINLIKIDTLTEAQEANALLNYSTYGIIKLDKRLKQLTQVLENTKKADSVSIQSARNKLKSIFDSVQYYRKIEKNIENLKPQKIKTRNYQAIFLTEILDKKTNKTKTDSLFLYVDEKKMIYTQSEFVQKSIQKYCSIRK